MADFQNQRERIGTRRTKAKFRYDQKYAKQPEKQKGNVRESRRLTYLLEINWASRA